MNYHYCAIKGPMHSDGIIETKNPIKATDMPAIRESIAKANGWEPSTFSIVSLTRL